MIRESTQSTHTTQVETMEAAWSKEVLYKSFNLCEAEKCDLKSNPVSKKTRSQLFSLFLMYHSKERYVQEHYLCTWYSLLHVCM